jgi:GTP cyclohydrolase I
MEVTGANIDISKNENFKKTPYRIAKMYLEMCQGLHHITEPSKVVEILKTNFPSKYDGMIIMDNIVCYSLCPHHFLPVKYRIDFAYIPGKTMLGLSKMPRFIKLLAQRPVLQEDFTREIISEFKTYVQPKGAMVVVKGLHNCVQCRGASQDNTECTTSEMTGVFEKEEATRLEFLELLKLKR